MKTIVNIWMSTIKFFWVLEDECTLIDQPYLALHPSHDSSIKKNNYLSMINQQVEITAK